MNKNNLVKGTICTVLIVSLLCLSLLPSVAVSASYEKLSEELIQALSTMSSNDELEVTVFFKEMDDSILRERLIDSTGKDIEVYENKSRFYNEVVPDIQVNGKLIKSIVPNSQISTSAFELNNEKSPLALNLRKDINLEITNEMNEYLADKREVRSDMIEEYITSVDDVFDSADIVFVSNYIEMIIVNLSKSEILSLSNDPNVEIIFYSNEPLDDNQENKSRNEAWHIPLLIETDSITGTGSANYNDGFGYDGTGVNIGIIESEGSYYESGHYSLAEAENSGKLSFVPTPGAELADTHNIHSTIISAIICGRKVTVNIYNNFRTYEGLACGANVYQTGIAKHEETQGLEFYKAVEMLISEPYNVNIINFSAKLGNFSGYTEYDKAVDEYVEHTGIVFVKSAGNDSGDISSPGKAYNAITVGCLEAKTGSGLLFGPYNIKSDSNWVDETYLPNKPDVVAPGTMITLPTSSTTFASVSTGGTSFSAPVVTGLAAQLMQDDVICLVNPNYVKNLILCGSSHEPVSESIISNGGLLEKSGAGLVNAVDSFAAKNNVYFEAYPYTYSNTNYCDVQSVKLNQGQTIRVVLSYHKEENIGKTEVYGNNLDIRLLENSTGVPRAISDSTKNNVELIEYTATTSGMYTIQVRLLESILSANGNRDLHDCISWRIY